MTDKERLEGIKNFSNMIKRLYWSENHATLKLAEGYFFAQHGDWLIEQAERAQEYDRELISLEDNKYYVSEILEQNKRYKQFIEHFAYCDEDYEGMLRLQNKAKKLIEGENRD